MAFVVTDAGYHLGQKVAVITDGERSSDPWFIRMAYVHRLVGDQFIRLYEVARLRSSEDLQVIPVDSVADVYIKHVPGRTHIQIDQVPDRDLVPWVETPKTDSWEAPVGTQLTREEMKQSFVAASVAARAPYEEIEKVDKVDKPRNVRKAVAAKIDEYLAQLHQAVEDYQLKREGEEREEPEPDKPINPLKAVDARFDEHLAKLKQAEEDYQLKQAGEEREEPEPGPTVPTTSDGQFKVGDRVRWKHGQTEGTVTAISQENEVYPESIQIVFGSGKAVVPVDHFHKVVKLLDTPQ